VTEVRKYDVVLIGGGIMSATLGTLIKNVAPEKSILIIERLDEIALESSNPWNNAGTGHAALCELNYMPDSKDGSLPDATKAIAINEQFQLSRQFWSSLVDAGVLSDPDTFIHSTPHMTFVRGEKDVDYLRRRFEVLKSQPLFEGMEFSTDPEVIRNWAPLLIEGRSGNEPIAATRIESGTDVDFGAITRQLVAGLEKAGAAVALGTEVTSLKRSAGGWRVRAKSKSGQLTSFDAAFVFVGAGGWALKLLQKAGIPEVDGYGTFPVGGQWLRTSNPDIVSKHHAKVYSQASVGAPPMSVPHLDTRVVDGKTSLLFGPYATSNPKFLKQGSLLDLPASIRIGNIVPYIAVGLSNLGLIKYLVGELLKTKSRKFASLKEFMPTARAEDWELLNAGQRAQIIKKDAQKGGVLQFGTEIITSADGSVSGLLGASPGASTAVYAMLQVLKSSFKTEYPAWESQLKKLMPELGVNLNSDPKLAKKSLARTAKTLKIK
jgi:malate dehydrogenase (quinone)